MALGDTSPRKTVAQLTDELVLACFVYENHKHALELLLQGADPSLVFNQDGKNPLHYACIHGWTKLGTYLLHNKNVDPNSQDKNEQTPLHCACMSSTLEMKLITALVETSKCDINARNKWNKTPLHYACTQGNLELVKLLVGRYNCNTFVHDDSDLTPLDYSKPNPEIVQYLQTYNDNLCKLSTACIKGNLDRVKHLVEALKCNPCGRDKFKEGMTPLHYACKHGYFEIVQYLLNQQIVTVDPNPQDDQKNTPLHYACQQGCVDIVKVLSKVANCNLKIRNSKAKTPLHYACEYGHFEVVWYLLNELLLDPKLEDDSFLHYVCKQGSVDLVKLLADSDMNVNWKNSKGRTPLHYACKYGHCEIVQYLVHEKHVDPYPLDSQGMTPLHYACRQRDVTIVKVFTSRYGLLYIHKQEKIPSFFQYAMKYDYNYLVQVLFENKYNLMACGSQDVYHLTLLYHAYIKGILDVVKILTETCQCPPLPVTVDTTPAIKQYIGLSNQKHHELFAACVEGKLDKVKSLVEDPDFKCNPYRRDNAKMTPLRYACKYGHVHVVAYILRLDSRKYDLILLHFVCQLRNLDLITMLVQDHGYDPNAKDENDCSPLHCAFHQDHDEVFVHLINQGCKPDEKEKQQMLLKACRLGSLSALKILIEKHKCSSSISESLEDGSILHTACSWGHIEIVHYLIEEQHCNPNVLDNHQQTPLHVACVSIDAMEEQALEVVIYLITAAHCDPNMKDISGKDALLLACIAGRAKIVSFLLVQCKCDPNTCDNEGNVPLRVATSQDVLNELLEHKASTKEMYKTHSKIFQFSKQQPLQSPVKVFVVGNPAAGKSTLVAALKAKTSISLIRKKVTGVDEKTAGIVSHEFETKDWGNIAVYDFAGQREFYSSHAVLLQNAIQLSPPIFLFVTDISKDDEKIRQSILYWITFVVNQCGSVLRKPHAIIVGSHADILKTKNISPESKVKMITSLQIEPQFKRFELVGVLAMDCQYSNTSVMKNLRHLLKQSCASVRIQEVLNFNSHCFLVYCNEKFKKGQLTEVSAVQMKTVLGQIKTDFSDRSQRKKNKVLKFLPITIQDLCSMCDDLNDRGHLLLLKDAVNIENSWIVLDKDTLLSRVTGTIFAPEGFKEHCQIASSTGVVPLNKLKQQFPDINSQMLVDFLSHLEFCREISDEELLALIDKHCEVVKKKTNRVSVELNNSPDSIDETSSLSTSQEQYYLFPGLITIEAPKSLWKPDPNFKYYFGWILQCYESSKEFFIPRFLQVLLLRLAFQFALVPDPRDINKEIPSLQRSCFIWKSGISWLNRDGIETLVEEVNHSTAVVVLMRCRRLSSEFLQLRSRVFQTVLDAVKTHSGKISTFESILDPSEIIEYPLKPISQLTLFSIKEIATTVCEGSECIMSNALMPVYVSKPLIDVLHFEPYANFKTTQILHKLFDECSSTYTSKVSNSFLSSIAEHTPNKVVQETFIELFKTNSLKLSEYMSRSPISGDVQKMICVFEIWRDSSEGTYKCLREKLDECSIFAGRNPLLLQNIPVMAKVSDEEDQTDSQDPMMQTHSTKQQENAETDSAMRDCMSDRDQEIDVGMLTIKDLKMVRTSTWDVRAKWDDVGVELGIDSPTLDAIKEDNEGVNKRFTAMLRIWLETQDLRPTWTSIVEALKSPPVDYPHLAEEIEKKYC